ncbi:hypothetical protein ACIP5Y_28490 [Nocardia sp. NPDC088792]|uniref:hypothetical protein n=1 Tax=Nocardia sp. NPDC088792 TaxID=3364332 RepID=UPI003802E8F7
MSDITIEELDVYQVAADLVLAIDGYELEEVEYSAELPTATTLHVTAFVDGSARRFKVEVEELED